MGQAPKFHTRNPTSQILTKSTAKTLITLNPIMSQAPKFHTHNPSSQILPKNTAKTLIPLNPIIDQAPKFHTHNSIDQLPLKKKNSPQHMVKYIKKMNKEI